VLVAGEEFDERRGGSRVLQLAETLRGEELYARRRIRERFLEHDTRLVELEVAQALRGLRAHFLVAVLQQGDEHRPDFRILPAELRQTPHRVQAREMIGLPVVRDLAEQRQAPVTARGQLE